MEKAACGQEALFSGEQNHKPTAASASMLRAHGQAEQGTNEGELQVVLKLIHRDAPSTPRRSQTDLKPERSQ